VAVPSQTKHFLGKQIPTLEKSKCLCLDVISQSKIIAHAVSVTSSGESKRTAARVVCTITVPERAHYLHLHSENNGPSMQNI
jgi:hypothetical protein